MDVVVDPYLSVHLRPHQREGVTFLYECVMGFRNLSGRGAILAWVFGSCQAIIISICWWGGDAFMYQDIEHVYRLFLFPAVMIWGLGKHYSVFLWSGMYLIVTGSRRIITDDLKRIDQFCCCRTLYKQGPYSGKPIIKRALIITPGSLVKASNIKYLGR